VIEASKPASNDQEQGTVMPSHQKQSWRWYSRSPARSPPLWISRLPWFSQAQDPRQPSDELSAALGTQDFDELAAALGTQDIDEPSAALGTQDIDEPSAALGTQDIDELSATPGTSRKRQKTTGLSDDQTERRRSARIIRNRGTKEPRRLRRALTLPMNRSAGLKTTGLSDDEVESKSRECVAEIVSEEHDIDDVEAQILDSGDENPNVQTFINMDYEQLRQIATTAIPTLGGSKKKKAAYLEALCDLYDLQLTEKEREDIKRKKSRRRSVYSKPQTTNQMKDDMVTRKVSVLLRHMEELQNCTTQDGSIEAKFSPMMVIFDGLVDRPELVKNKRKRKATFLVPKNFNQKEFASELASIARDMNADKNQGLNWECTNKPKEFFLSVFPRKTFEPQGNNKQRKPKNS
jgi:hypothetical protein